MTTLTDREKALVEAVRLLCHNWMGGPCVPLQDALRAYDPPKEKVYVLPTWEELVRDKPGFSNGTLAFGHNFDFAIRRSFYEELRELTAKEQE